MHWINVLLLSTVYDFQLFYVQGSAEQNVIHIQNVQEFLHYIYYIM